MKLYLTALALLISLQCLRAQTTISTLSSGEWDSPSTWDLGRQPRDGDIIVIQPAHQVSLGRSVKLSNVVLRINGELRIDARTGMTLAGGSIMNLLNGGSIVPETVSGDAWISLGGAMKYRTSKTFNAAWGVGKVFGLAYATATSGNVDQGGQGFIFGTLPAVWQDLQLFRTPENFVQMVWVTSHESTSRTFHVERSRDAHAWESIGTIYSTGQSGGAIIYSFMDVQPGSGIVYYRVGQEDADGGMKISPVRSLKMGSSMTSNISIWPNPSNGPVTLTFPEPLASAIIYDVLDLQGHVVMKGNQEIGSSSMQLDLAHSPAGIYLIKLVNPVGETHTSRVVKY
jgi:hypothetical protein